MTLDTYTVAQMLSWLALLGILSYSWWSNRHALALVRSEARLLTQTVATLSQQLGLIHQAVIPLNLAIQQVLVKELTHYHTPVLDALMAKLGPPLTLTEDEEQDLLRLLAEREQDMGELITAEERDAARILPVIIRRVRHDLAHTTPATILTLHMVSEMPHQPEEGKGA